jgi:hypothetical protein
MPDAAALSALAASRFPSAATLVVQPLRGPVLGMASCEGIARGSKVRTERVAFTGTRVAFGSQEKDAVLAFQRLDRDLAEVQASAAGIVFTNLYPLTKAAGELAEKQRKASSVIEVEGLASVEAGFAIDAVAAIN